MEREVIEDIVDEPDTYPSTALSVHWTPSFFLRVSYKVWDTLYTWTHSGWVSDFKISL